MEEWINGFSHKGIAEINSRSAEKISPDDLVLLNWLAKFIDSGSMISKKDSAGNMLYWVDYGTVAAEFACFGWTKKTVYRHLSKLVRLEVLTHSFECAKGEQRGAFSFYGIGRAFQTIKLGDTLGQKCPRGSDKNVLGARTKLSEQRPYNQRPINHIPLTSKQSISNLDKQADNSAQEESSSVVCSIASAFVESAIRSRKYDQQLSAAIRAWFAHLESIGQPTAKKTAVQTFCNQVDINIQFSGKDAVITAIEAAIRKGHRRIQWQEMRRTADNLQQKPQQQRQPEQPKSAATAADQGQKATLSEIWQYFFDVKLTDKESDTLEREVKSGSTLEDIKDAANEALLYGALNPFGYTLSILRTWRKKGKQVTKRAREPQKDGRESWKGADFMRYTPEERREIYQAAVVNFDDFADEKGE